MFLSSYYFLCFLFDDEIKIRFFSRFFFSNTSLDETQRAKVEMVRSFVSAAASGDSRVQQMIMGAGKTTVIGPLLTLLLADGQHLVTQARLFAPQPHPVLFFHLRFVSRL